MYSIDQLKFLVCAVDKGSFSAAARHLGRAQSAISQGIANLEIDMGLQLFDRSTRKPHLTVEGQRLLEYARAALQQMDELEAAAQSVRRGEEAVLRIALDDSLFLPAFGAICARFAEQFPNTELDLRAMAAPDVNRAVLSGSVDLGLSYSEVDMDSRLNLCFIGNLPFVVVCATNYPLSDLSSIATRDLLSSRQLLLKGSSGMVEKHWPQLSAQVLWSSSFFGLREMALAGLGWTYLPLHMVEDLVADRRLHQLKVDFDHRPWSPPVELVLPKSMQIGPALEWLHEALKQLL